MIDSAVALLEIRQERAELSQKAVHLLDLPVAPHRGKDVGHTASWDLSHDEKVMAPRPSWPDEVENLGREGNSRIPRDLWQLLRHLQQPLRLGAQAIRAHGFDQLQDQGLRPTLGDPDALIQATSRLLWQTTHLSVGIQAEP